MAGNFHNMDRPQRLADLDPESRDFVLCLSRLSKAEQHMVKEVMKIMHAQHLSQGQAEFLRALGASGAMGERWADDVLRAICCGDPPH